MAGNNTIQTVGFTVASDLNQFVELAINRFSYLFPEISITVENDVQLSAPADVDLSTAVRDFRFELYRQKIFHDTLPLRQTLISAVMT